MAAAAAKHSNCVGMMMDRDYETDTCLTDSSGRSVAVGVAVQPHCVCAVNIPPFFFPVNFTPWFQYLSLLPWKICCFAAVAAQISHHIFWKADAPRAGTQMHMLYRTALMMCAANGVVESLQIFLSTDENADVDVSDGDDMTAVHLAAMNGHHAAVQMLIDKKHVNLCARFGARAWLLNYHLGL